MIEKEKEKMRKIIVEIKTESNCLIGSATQSFSIGGVDQCTTLDNAGNPVIQASAFKGSLRAIIKNEGDDMKETKKFYKNYLEKLINRFKEYQKNNPEDGLQDIIERREENLKNIKAEYLFGIEGINTMPRLYFSDLKVIGEEKEAEDYFVIDSKTLIETDEKSGEVISNPRIYKAIKPDVKFRGEIILKDFEDEEINVDEIINEIIKKLKLFDEGYHRIGNSKTRGYGKISIETEIERQGEKIKNEKIFNSSGSQE